MLEDLYKEGVIETSSGLLVDLLDPKPEQIEIEDIAHALAHICRFGGHVNSFYSVAQHSLMCALHAPRRLQLHALLHDASEAYLGDIPTPLKRILGAAYTDLEQRFMDVIHEKFNVPKLSDQDQLLLKQIDKNRLEEEYHVGFHGSKVVYRSQILNSKETFLSAFESYRKNRYAN